MDFRREPFRLFFPFGTLLGLSGVLPWVLFGSGAIQGWPGVYHAFTMTQGFLVALAAGFLTTMLPRRTGTAPPSWIEIGLIALGLSLVPPSLAAGAVWLAQLAYLGVLATLAQFAVRRFLARSQSAASVPASFVFLPVGLLGGVVGAGLLLGGALAPGRSLIEEGLLDGLVLALAPMLHPAIAHDRPATATGAAVPRWTRLAHAGAALAIAATFVVEHALHQRVGLAARGTIVLGLLLAAGLLRWPTAPGLHRRVFHAALVLVPAGPLAAAARPEARVPLMHLTFVGGMSLLVFAVATHVTLMHSGQQALARRRPWAVALFASLILLAALARAQAERFSSHYFEALTVAASLWLLGVVTWALFCVPLLLRPRRRYRWQ